MGTKITNRIEPCRCGCHGQDPWHQKAYTRRIFNMVDASGTVPTAMKKNCRYDKQGWVRVPWSKDPVRVVHVVGDGYKFGWFFAKD